MSVNRDTARLLIIEDDEDLRLTVLETITDEGWEARGAATGPEALELLETWVPDVILLDLILPVMAARTFRAELETRSHVRSIPVVVMSGVADVRVGASVLGAAGAIAKPFDINTLIRLLTHVVNTRRAVE
jgi:CheY-like chemotaxis protein